MGSYELAPNILEQSIYIQGHIARVPIFLFSLLRGLKALYDLAVILPAIDAYWFRASS